MRLQPVQDVDVSSLTFTQNVVNMTAVNKPGGNSPIQVARYKGKNYLLDGHHRVAREALAGKKVLDAYFLDLDRKPYMTVLKYNPWHDELGRFTDGESATFMSIGDPRGAKIVEREKEKHEAEKDKQWEQEMDEKAYIAGTKMPTDAVPLTDKTDWEKASEVEIRDALYQGHGVHLHSGSLTGRGRGINIEGKTPSAKEMRDVLKNVSLAMDEWRALGIDPKALPVQVRVHLNLPKSNGGRAYFGRPGMILASHFQRMTPEKFDYQWRSQARARLTGNRPLWTRETEYLGSTRLTHEEAAREYGKSVFRHEYGHNASNMYAHTEFSDLAKEQGKSWIRDKISQYGSSNIMETMAETFSMVTSPNYKPGTLPEKWEKAVGSMLTGKPSRTSDFVKEAVRGNHRHFFKKFDWAKSEWEEYAKESASTGGKRHKEFAYKGIMAMALSGSPPDPGVDAPFNPEFEDDWFSTATDPEAAETDEMYSDEQVGGYRKTRKTRKVQGLDY
jgi:hypothetical protein